MKTHPSYQETIEYLYRQLPMYQREGTIAAKYSLDNIHSLCDHLGKPQEQFQSIHIAGTNGKGSVAHLLSGMLQAQGLRIGLYTSPHYSDFRERIKINGSLISPEEITRFVGLHKAAFERIKPSFFEWSVALAFHYFAVKKVDFAVVEVGLGGRLDSTNILKPELCVITNIGLDHQQFLGDSIPLIAREKAGIIKKGVPVVIGETQAETRSIFLQIANEHNAPLSWADQVWNARRTGSGDGFQTFDLYRLGKLTYQDLVLGLTGEYQKRNLVSALQSLEVLSNSHFLPSMDEKAIRQALKDVRSLTNMKGRWEIIGKDPLIICDSAHNGEGMYLAMQQLKKLSSGRKHLVIGTVGDKDLNELLSPLPKDGHYYFAKPEIPRGLPAEELQRKAAELGLRGDPYPSVAKALDAARRNATSEEVIYVGGSTFVVAEVI